MKKICAIFLMILCVTLSSVGFASGTVTITGCQATLKSISIYHETQGWITFFNGSEVLTAGSEKHFVKNMADGLPEGRYTQIKYEFDNDFVFTGYLTVSGDQEKYNGTYGSTNQGNPAVGNPYFVKDQAPQEYHYKSRVKDMKQDSDGILSSGCDGTTYTAILNESFTINSTLGKAIEMYFDKNYVCYGTPGFGDFGADDKASPVAAPGDNSEHTSKMIWSQADGTDRITAPWIDAPEIHVSK